MTGSAFLFIFTAEYLSNSINFFFSAMYTCSICHCCCTSLSLFLKHVTLHKNASNMQIQCPLSGCKRVFRKIGSVYSHLSRDHKYWSRFEAPLALLHEAVPLACSVATCLQVCSNLKSLICHLKGHILQLEAITCPFPGCARTYKKKSSFESHISRCHRFAMQQAHVDEQRSLDSFDHSPDQEVGASCDVGSQSNGDFVRNQSQVIDAFGLLYLRLLSEHLVPSSTVQIISEAFFDLQNNNLEQMLSELRRKLDSVGISDSTSQEVLHLLSDNDQILKAHSSSGVLRSPYARKEYFKERFSYVEPVAILLGKNKKNQDATFHYVPIIDTLKALLYDESVVSQCLNPLSTEVGVLRDFVDGIVHKSIPLFDQQSDAVKLLLFQDAFEVVNPLGSAKKKHKILAVYFMLGNLYPWNRSRIHAIQLVLLCKESDFEFFGQEKVFAPLLEDIRRLENGSCQLRDGKNLYGAVVAILGDNLGSHTIGGFVENFSKAKHMCRFCLTEKKDMFVESNLTGTFELRKKSNYDRSLTILSQDDTLIVHEGVKFDSLFNRLRYFHVCAPGLPPCLGHDLFEGVVSYDIALYVQYFVHKCRWFTLEELNRSISLFNFKQGDANDRPSEVNLKQKLSGHAVQNWNMLRFLPVFVFGKVLDLDDPVWQQVLMLSEIVQLICTPAISLPMIMRLKDLIEDYLLGRLELFPFCSLRPKHHFLAHYPYLIMQFGPLIRVWTMRCESKHGYFRKCARNCQNFKNITSTLAERHQLLQAYKASGCLFPTAYPFTSASRLQLSLYSDDIQKVIKDFFGSDDDIYYAYNAEYRGLAYRRDMILVLSREDDRLVFGQIILILAKGPAMCFLVRVTRSSLEPSMQLYNLYDCESGSLKCVTPSSIIDYVPLEAYRLGQAQRPIVVLKHAVLDLI